MKSSKLGKVGLFIENNDNSIFVKRFIMAIRLKVPIGIGNQSI